MNAAFLLMSSALVTGADPQAAPAAAPPAAAVVAPAPHAAPCCAIPAPCSDACARRGLFAHMRLWGHRDDCGCGHRDRCDRHVFHGFTTAGPCNTGCDPCGVERHGWGSGPGLLSRLRAKFGHRDCCDAAPCCPTPSCAVPPIPGGAPPVAPPVAPEKMPAPAKDKKDPKGTAQVVPGLSPVAAGGSPF